MTTKRPEDNDRDRLGVNVQGLSFQDIDDILTVAFEGGSNYWLMDAISDADMPVYTDRPLLPGTDMHRQVYCMVSQGFGLTIVDDEGERHRLTRDDVVQGVQRFARHRGLDSFGTNEVEQLDADEADSILQFALFGEIIYG